MRTLHSVYPGLGTVEKDIQRIVSVCLKNGYKIHPSSAYLAWRIRANSLMLDWTPLPIKDDDLLTEVLFWTIEE